MSTTDEWGITDGYLDVEGEWHATPAATREAIRVAMGGLADSADPPPRSRPVWFVREGSAPHIQRPAVLALEDGTELGATHSLPPDLPIGYHDLHPDDGGPTTRLIVAPDRCHAAGRRRWGWSAQLYATRSQASWGIGDLADLTRLLRWSGDHGAGIVTLNPLHAPLPLPEQQPSPYYPSSRRFRSPLYLRIEHVPGYDPSDPVLADAAAAGRALDAQRRIDRDEVHRLKLLALERIWERTREGHQVASFALAAAEGRDLDSYAAFCAIAEHHGTGWRSWPSEHRRPDNPGVARFAVANEDRVRFHRWVQCLLDDQLAEAAAAGRAVGCGILGDLAVGVDPAGADAWRYQDVIAAGVRIGAPPDPLGPHGQDWGLPPFIPWKLRAVGYQPFARTLRSALRHLDAVRIDHVMGLFRLFWIADGGAEHGAYVRYPGEELLDVVAIESRRAGVTVVGEDLGTVEDEVRESLHDRGVLTYRVAWFEDDPPEEWPEPALATLSTHDLPTLAGLWDDTDGALGDDELRERLVALAPDATDAAVAAVEASRRLGASPSVLAVVSLDDALGVRERVNVPGTTTEHPNWSLALPAPLEEVEHHPGVAAVARALHETR